MLQGQYHGGIVAGPGRFSARPAPTANGASPMPVSVRPIRIEGNIAHVTLTKGYVAVIDAEDVPLVDGLNWTTRVSPWGVYAYRKATGGRRNVHLHRVLMGDPDGLQVDHIDGDSLNNRRSNLRVATASQNSQNTKRRKDNGSGFKGVSFDKARGLWNARIWSKCELKRLGYYRCRTAAAVAYVKASRELHGEFARMSQ